MGQRRNYAAEKDVRTKLSKQECARGTGLSSNVAAVKDAQIELRREECALDMEQR